MDLSLLGQPALARIEAALSRPDDDGLLLLRHTLMNPWLLAQQNPGEVIVEASCQFIALLIAQPRAPIRFLPEQSRSLTQAIDVVIADVISCPPHGGRHGTVEADAGVQRA